MAQVEIKVTASEREAILAGAPPGLTPTEESLIIAAVSAQAAAEVRRVRAFDEVVILRAARYRAQTLAKGEDARSRRLTAQLRDAEQDLEHATIETGRLAVRATNLKLAAQARRRDAEYAVNQVEAVAHQQREQGKREAAARAAAESMEAAIAERLRG